MLGLGLFRTDLAYFSYGVLLLSGWGLYDMHTTLS